MHFFNQLGKFIPSKVLCVQWWWVTWSYLFLALALKYWKKIMRSSTFSLSESKMTCPGASVSQIKGPILCFKGNFNSTMGRLRTECQTHETVSQRRQCARWPERFPQFDCTPNRLLPASRPWPPFYPGPYRIRIDGLTTEVSLLSFLIAFTSENIIVKSFSAPLRCKYFFKKPLC